MEETIKNFKVVFKETYMNHEVERHCSVRSREELIDIYGLNEPDIEYYKITEE